MIFTPNQVKLRSARSRNNKLMLPDGTHRSRLIDPWQQTRVRLWGRCRFARQNEAVFDHDSASMRIFYISGESLGERFLSTLLGYDIGLLNGGVQVICDQGVAALT